MRNPAVTVSAEIPRYSSPPSISPANGTENFTYICARYGVLSLAKRMSRLMREKLVPPRAATSKFGLSFSKAGDKASSRQRNGLVTVSRYRSRFASIQAFLLCFFRSAKNRKISGVKMGLASAIFFLRNIARDMGRPKQSSGSLVVTAAAYARGSLLLNGFWGRRTANARLVSVAHS